MVKSYLLILLTRLISEKNLRVQKASQKKISRKQTVEVKIMENRNGKLATTIMLVVERIFKSIYILKNCCGLEKEEGQQNFIVCKRGFLG